MEKQDATILSVCHVVRRGHATFAAIRFGTKSIHDHLERPLESIKELVGEFGLSYDVASAADELKVERLVARLATSRRTQVACVESPAMGPHSACAPPIFGSVRH